MKKQLDMQSVPYSTVCLEICKKKLEDCYGLRLDVFKCYFCLFSHLRGSYICDKLMVYICNFSF